MLIIQYTIQPSSQLNQPLSMSVNIYQSWHYIPNGETISITECRQLTPVNQYLWGDVWHHLYKRGDGKLFIYSD